MNSSQMKMRDLWGRIQIELQAKNFKLVKKQNKNKNKNKKKNTVTYMLNTRLVN